MQNTENKDVLVICSEHGTLAGSSSHLDTDHASKYNNCLSCAIEMKRAEQGDSAREYLFTQKEVGLLIGEQKGNVYQIEQAAMRKFKQSWMLMFPDTYDLIAKKVFGSSESEEYKCSHSIATARESVYGLLEDGNLSSEYL